MTSKEITARKGKGEEGVLEGTVSYNYAETADEAIQMFGAEAVLSGFSSQLTVDLQALIRRGLEKGLPIEVIQDQASKYRPGVSADTSVNPVVLAEAHLNYLKTSDPAAAQAFLARLQEISQS